MDVTCEPLPSHLHVVARGRFDAQEARVPARIAILVAEPQRHTAALEDTAVNRGALVCTTSSEAEARAFLGLG